MSETVATRNDSRPTGATTSHGGFLSSLFPRFDAAVSPEFYRLSGKLRAITNLLFIISNLALAPQVEALGFDPSVHWRVLAVFLTVHTVDGCLSLWLWRGRMPARRMRHITYTSAMLETAGVLFAAWVYGSVNSPFIGVELLFISIYRLAFDFRIGVATFATILLGQWLLVAFEISGILPSQPIAAVLDGVYQRSAREIGSMVNLTFVLALTFAVSNWAVGRLRYKDLAIRMLRESLRAAEQGRVGHHTGRTLRDTYTLGGLLGVGGMGEVYVAMHLRTQRRVAVKMLHGHLVEDPAVLDRFQREAEVTGQLGSDHIVGVIDVDRDDGQPFIVLELVEGESLGARIDARGPLALDELAELIDQLAAGLDVAHRAGIVHRDLKPENIYLCPKRGGGFKVKILDFGVSKIRGSLSAITHEIAIVGTPDYMSPEQARGHADEVDATSDVFAVGGLAYKCLTGKRPFHGDSVPALLRSICDDQPAPIGSLRADVPPAVSSVIALAMAKHIDERYRSASDFARDLRAAIAGTLDAAVIERAHGLSHGRPSQRRRKRPSTIDVTGETHRG